MYRTFKRFLAWGLIACLPLVLAGCGDDGGGAGPLAAISGVATVSNPVSGARVEVYKLNGDGSSGVLLGSGTTGSDGKYTVDIPVGLATPPLLVKISGQGSAAYLSEAAGELRAFSPDESFHAVVDTLAVNRVSVVSPLTEVAYQKLQQILTVNPGVAADAKIIGAVNILVAALFNVSNIQADPATNLANQATLLVIDQMIADSGTTTLPAMNIINQAFAETSGAAYQTYLIALGTAGAAVIADVSGRSTQLAASVQALLDAARVPQAEPDWSDTTPPTAPADLMVTVETNSSTGGSATLSWAPSSDNNGITGYDVYRDGSFLARVSSPGYKDTTLIPGATYDYYVIAIDGAGNRSGQSNTVSATVNPVNLDVTISGRLSVDSTDLP